MATQQVFIALQCCQCSTMQVKQQKRSSNKWVCAVCNQKQSVLKVFARGYLARDVRGFVQRFNMSRMTAGEPGSGAPAQIGGDAGDDARASPSSGDLGCSRPRRTDWLEYLDPDEEESTAEDASREAISGYPDVVTEIPTEMLRRPFQRGRPNPRNTSGNDAFKPTFPSRKQKLSPQLRVQDSGGGKKRPRVASEASSKWSEYLQEDPDETSERMGSPEAYGDGHGPHGRTSDMRIEEEVHPDFL